ncbi:MAG: hypothetical protein LBQ54_04910 [Planctomycetaceae bacterium]|nr:hypothetical protein [Planctomycetaceae bacterium]
MERSDHDTDGCSSILPDCMNVPGGVLHAGASRLFVAGVGEWNKRKAVRKIL